MHSSIQSARKFGPRIAAAVLLVAFSSTALAGPKSGRSFLTISGTPPTSVLAGQPYLFQPTATSRYGRALTFSISNKPAWAYFDRATGKLWGTPQATNVGSYPNIVIGVTEDRKTARLPAFTITVMAVATAPVTERALEPAPAPSPEPEPTLTPEPEPAPAPEPVSTTPLTQNVTITWLPPTQNTDGSVMGDLAGYTIAYGTVRGGPYSSSVSVSNPSLSAYVVESLTPGTYYFAIKARNSAGVESSFSNEASKTID